MELVASKNRWWNKPRERVVIDVSGNGQVGLTAWAARLESDFLWDGTQSGIREISPFKRPHHLGGHKVFSFLAGRLIGPTGAFEGLLKCENKVDKDGVPSGEHQFTQREFEIIKLLLGAITTAACLRGDLLRISDAVGKVMRRAQACVARDDLLDTIIKETVEVLHADRGDFAWWTAEHADLVYAAQHGITTNPELARNSVVPANAFIRSVFEESQTDYRIDGHVDPAKPPYVVCNSNTRSELAVRVDLFGNPVGVLNVESTCEHYFTEEIHLPLLRLLAQQAALAVQRVQRDRLLQNALEHQSNDKPESILQPILNGLLEACGFDAGMVYRFEKTSNCLRVAASRHSHDVTVNPSEFTHPLNKQSLAKASFNLPDDAEPLIVAKDDPIVDQTAREGWKIEGPILGYPLRFRNQPVGCLVLWSQGRRFPRFPPAGARLKEFARLAAAKIALWQAYQQLDESESYYKALGEGSPLIHLTKRVSIWEQNDKLPPGIKPGDVKLVFEWANQEFLQFVGCVSLDEVRGQTDWDLFGPEHAYDYYQGDLQTLSDNRVTAATEEIVRPSDKKLRHIRVWKRAFAGADRRTDRIQVMLWDRTEEQKVDEEREVFLEHLMHGIKECFETTNGVLDDQFRRAPADAERQIVRECQMRLEYMEVLIRALYARRKGQPVQMKSFLTDVAEAVERAFNPQAEGASIELDTTGIEDVEFPERTALHCALAATEVIANAFRHAFKSLNDGKVSVSLSNGSANKMWQLKVLDDGVGTSRTPPFPPDTIGLGLVQQIVEEQLGGSFHLGVVHPSTERKGTLFQAQFTPDIKRAELNLRMPPEQNQKPTVLLVEDHFSSGLRYKQWLTDDGYWVFGPAGTKADAIRAARECDPKVIVLDIELGEERYAGLEAAKEIQKFSDVPIVFLTHHRRDDQRIKEAAGHANRSTLIKSSTVADNLLLRVREALLSRIRGRKIFICYPHERQRYCTALRKHLKLIRSTEIQTWSDHDIKDGEEWRKRIDEALQASIAAVILVSAELMGSAFVQIRELPELLRAAKTRGTLLFPVQLFATSTELPSGFDLRDFHFVKDAENVATLDKPMGERDEAEQEKVWHKIAEDIKSAVGSLPPKCDLDDSRQQKSRS